MCSSDSEHSRGKTLVFPQLRQFSVHKLSCQINFCKMMNFQLTPLSKNFPKPCMFLLPLCLGTILAPICPVSCSPPLSSGVHHGDLVPPLQPLYDSPYGVLRRGPRSFTIRVGSRDEVVAVSRLKACTAADATPGSPRRHSRPPGLHRGGPAATKRVSFSDPLVSSPSFPAASLNRFPTQRGGLCTPGTGGAITGATDVVPVPSTGTATKVGPLTSSPPSRRQSSGEALWTGIFQNKDRSGGKRKN